MGKVIDYNRPLTFMITLGLLAGGLYGISYAEEETIKLKVRVIVIRALASSHIAKHVT
jgi:hypothetical protein